MEGEDNPEPNFLISFNFYVIGFILENIPQCHMLYVQLSWSHQISFGNASLLKIGKKLIQRLIVGKGQMIHKFFHFQNFVRNSLFAYLSQVKSKAMPFGG